MPKLTIHLPEYKEQKSRNKGFYWLDGKKIYLPGRFGSEESFAAYDQHMGFLREKRKRNKSVTLVQLQPYSCDINQLTVAELGARFCVWGESHYVKAGKPTGSLAQYEAAFRAVRKMYGHLPVFKFKQQELKAVLKHFESTLCRLTANLRLSRVKRIFNWGVSEGLISFDIAKNLEYVEGLQKGRTKAKEARQCLINRL